MAKKQIVWSPKAELTFVAILDFYIERNGNSSFSNKIYREINQLLSLLLAFPKLGKQTSDVRFRMLIHRVYKVYYQIKKDRIIIHMIWDTRQNPDDLKL